MREWLLPRHLPLVETVGLALTVLALMLPEDRRGWLIALVGALYAYCTFWSLVDMQQQGLLSKRVQDIYADAKRTGRRTRFQGAAFSVLGCMLLVQHMAS